MRQLLTYWPPRMVSAKWVFQSSRSSTFASAAAMPPSAITVWAFPRSDMQTRPTVAPWAEASIAALSPHPPAPLHGALVEPARAAVGSFAHGSAREPVQKPAHQVPKRVASQGGPAEENDVQCQHQAPDADSKCFASGRRVEKPHALPGVVREYQDEEKGQVQEVPVDVLQDERERVLAAVGLSGLSHGAVRGIRPERFVVRAAVVIAGESKSARRPEDQERGRERQKGRPEGGLRSEPAMGGIAENLRRVKRRKVVAMGVVLALECRPGGVHDEGGKTDERQEGLNPPPVPPRRRSETALLHYRIRKGAHEAAILTQSLPIPNLSVRGLRL